MDNERAEQIRAAARLGLATLGVMALVVAVGYGLVQFLFLGLARGSPLRAALSLGGLVLLLLGAALAGTRTLARRLGDRPDTRRMLLAAAVLLLMALTPLLMIAIIIFVGLAQMAP
jgi:hypothetical protein